MARLSKQENKTEVEKITCQWMKNEDKLSSIQIL